jgi:hypothetical protein
MQQIKLIIKIYGWVDTIKLIYDMI